MDTQLAWAMPIVSMLTGAIAYLYKRQSDAETARATKAEERADALQKVINDRAAESERLAQETMRENAALRADMAQLTRSIAGKDLP